MYSIMFLHFPVYIFAVLHFPLSGRRLTAQGTRDLDRIAGQVRN